MLITVHRSGTLAPRQAPVTWERSPGPAAGAARPDLGERLSWVGSARR
jgi:hypothetical protein